MPYCSSCGSPIPEGQGKSCSMCYGDIDHGKDGYYRQMMEEEEQQEYKRQAEHQQHEEMIEYYQTIEEEHRAYEEIVLEQHYDKNQ